MPDRAKAWARFWNFCSLLIVVLDGFGITYTYGEWSASVEDAFPKVNDPALLPEGIRDISMLLSWKTSAPILQFRD
jgi:hypothetical protein